MAKPGASFKHCEFSSWLWHSLSTQHLEPSLTIISICETGWCPLFLLCVGLSVSLHGTWSGYSLPICKGWAVYKRQKVVTLRVVFSSHMEQELPSPAAFPPSVHPSVNAAFNDNFPVFLQVSWRRKIAHFSSAWLRALRFYHFHVWRRWEEEGLWINNREAFQFSSISACFVTPLFLPHSCGENH